MTDFLLIRAVDGQAHEFDERTVDKGYREMTDGCKLRGMRAANRDTSRVRGIAAHAHKSVFL